MAQKLKRIPLALTKKSTKHKVIDEKNSAEPKKAIKSGSNRQQKIVAALCDVKENYASIVVTFTGYPEEYSSLILDVDAADESFIIDELSPEKGHSFVKLKSKVKISTHAHDIPIDFVAKVCEIGKDKGIFYYKLSLPNAIKETQRRQHPRVSCQNMSKISASLKIPNVPQRTAKIIDISATGIKVAVSHNLTSVLKKGDIIPEFLLHMPNQRIIRTSLEMRHLAYLHGKITTIIGGKFIKVRVEDKNYLTNFVSQLINMQK